jgi:diketogulonate reductase-like aldo/keto reductase
MALATYNQISVPTFMYGTAWKKDATSRLVQMAVETGFKAIDTANQLIHYQEALVGEALQLLAQKGLKREALFLQTKFTSADGQDHRTPYDRSADLTTQVKQSFDSSLHHLRTDYLDSYVLHAPFSRHGLGPADWQVWTAMEELYKSGKTKMIGVSNITAAQLSLLCQNAQVKPMMVQNRCFAITAWDRQVREVCREHGSIYQAFSLLTANPDVLVAPEVRAIAAREGVGPAQVVFRFAMQIGMLPLTGTTSKNHMSEDLAAERVSLSADEGARIETIAL